jgi:uncharacterized protein with von Willebrand factor type A (vWA) domain
MDDTDLSEGTGRLADNIVHFARALRAAGLPVGSGAVLDALAAVRAAGLGSREDVYWTLHATLVTRHEHSAVFDHAFRLFWRKRGLIEKLMRLMMPAAPGPARGAPPASRRVEDALYAGLGDKTEVEKEIEVHARLTQSTREVLKRKDFAQMSAAEIEEAARAIQELRLPADVRPTRRLMAARRGQVDLRRTLRASLAGGGDVIALKFRGPKVAPPPVVALADISGSMAEYSRPILHFLHALSQRRHVQTFLFATRLTNVTRELTARDVDEALARCGKAAPDFEGGTRLAAALAAFNRRWSRRVLGQGATVLLFTDGLEREVGDELGFELDRLHRSARRLIWLNPLLRFEGFAAKAGGIRAMLPHVDEFRPIHNLSSMADLCRALGARSPAFDPKRWLAA